MVRKMVKKAEASNDIYRFMDCEAVSYNEKTIPAGKIS